MGTEHNSPDISRLPLGQNPLLRRRMVIEKTNVICWTLFISSFTTGISVNPLWIQGLAYWKIIFPVKLKC